MLALCDRDEAGGKPGGGPGSGIPGCQPPLWDEERESTLGPREPSVETSPVDAALLAFGGNGASLTSSCSDLP